MPEPVLRWLETSGRADLGARRAHRAHRPEVSGVGAGALISLAPSIIDPAVRIAERRRAAARRAGDLAAAVPHGLRSVDVDLVLELVSRGNDALVDYCGHEPICLLPLGQVPLGWAGAVGEAPLPRRARHAGIAIGSRGGGLSSTTRQRRALGLPRRASRCLPAPERLARPRAAGRLPVPSAGRLPDGDGDRGARMVFRHARRLPVRASRTAAAVARAARPPEMGWSARSRRTRPTRG